MCFVSGNFVAKSANTFFVDGLMTVDDRMRIFPLAEATSDRREEISLSTLVQEAMAPPANGVFRRELSYKESTDACTRALTAPLVTDDMGLPSILIGRPSRVFTNMLA